MNVSIDDRFTAHHPQPASIATASLMVATQDSFNRTRPRYLQAPMLQPERNLEPRCPALQEYGRYEPVFFSPRERRRNQPRSVGVVSEIIVICRGNLSSIFVCLLYA